MHKTRSVLIWSHQIQQKRWFITELNKNGKVDWLKSTSLSKALLPRFSIRLVFVHIVLLSPFHRSQCLSLLSVMSGQPQWIMLLMLNEKEVLDLVDVVAAEIHPLPPPGPPTHCQHISTSLQGTTVGMQLPRLCTSCSALQNGGEAAAMVACGGPHSLPAYPADRIGPWVAHQDTLVQISSLPSTHYVGKLLPPCLNSAASIMGTIQLALLIFVQITSRSCVCSTLYTSKMLYKD